MAFQYKGEILYRCCQPITAGQELLVWYEEEYAKHLGVTFNYLWSKKSPGDNGNVDLCLISDYLHTCAAGGIYCRLCRHVNKQ